MIIVKMMGGLGNQMFQYAAARRLADYRKANLFLDVSGYKDMPDIDTPRHYELDSYAIRAALADSEQLKNVLEPDFQPSLAFKAKWRAGLDKRLRTINEDDKGFNKRLLSVSDNSYLIGWWQNEKYFSDIRDKLVKEFTPKMVSTYSQDMLKKIGSVNSVSVHVRRGDYVTNKYANTAHGLLSLEHYKKAIAYLESKANTPHFFIFSDDPTWCQQNLSLGKKSTIVDGNGSKRDYEDIYLMRHCKHNIVANSSFSWWGGWLNENPDKIVVAPKQWFADRETEIVPSTWTKL